MRREDRPQAFGVFKPVGHVVLAFPPGADVDGAVDNLRETGFKDGDLVRYTPAQMVAQVEDDIAHASPLSSLGQELNLVKAHRALAERGYRFLVVRAPSDARTALVTRAARAHGAERAQKYGTFVVEELLSQPDEHQVFESAARGLDNQAAPRREGNTRR
jgi:hypothetical protein